MKAMTFDKSFAEKKDTFANLIANLSRMVPTTSERLFYIKLLTRGFRSTPICIQMRLRSPPMPEFSSRPEWPDDLSHRFDGGLNCTRDMSMLIFRTLSFTMCRYVLI